MQKEINNTAPLYVGKHRLSREFTGKTEGFANNVERNFYSKMLKAYCKGASRFAHGFKNGVQQFHPVEQRYFYV